MLYDVVRSALIARRKQLRLSRTKVAIRAPVSSFRYALYEMGDGELTTDELDRIAKVLEAERVRMSKIEPLSAARLSESVTAAQ